MEVLGKELRDRIVESLRKESEIAAAIGKSS